MFNDLADHDMFSSFSISANKFYLSRDFDLVNHLRKSRTNSFWKPSLPIRRVHVLMVEIDADGVKTCHLSSPIKFDCRVEFIVKVLVVNNTLVHIGVDAELLDRQEFYNFDRFRSLPVNENLYPLVLYLH